MATDFQLDFLDHVAIRVRDIEASAAWYEHVLGLQRVQPEGWRPFPIMMLAGDSGIAIFPAKVDDSEVPTTRNVKLDHFAFRVSNAAFEMAKAHYEALAIEYYFQDHQYFHSIYTLDPDGHTVELTTQVLDF